MRASGTVDMVEQWAARKTVVLQDIEPVSLHLEKPDNFVHGIELFSQQRKPIQYYLPGNWSGYPTS